MNRDRATLSQILERVERAREFAGADKNKLLASLIVQDAVIRQLEVIGEAAKRISAPTRALSVDVPWKGMVGFKDVVIHQHDSVNLERMWQIVREELPGLASQVRRVLAKLSDPCIGYGQGPRPARWSGPLSTKVAIHVAPFSQGLLAQLHRVTSPGDRPALALPTRRRSL